MTALAFTLQPEERYLELTAPLHELVDVFEICPETTWRPDGAGHLVPNGFHAMFLARATQLDKRCIAHGVAFSLGSARPDPARRAQWLARIREDRDTFGFEWYTDHLGATEMNGQALVLPLPLPHVDAAAERVRASLSALQSVVPDVGFENSVFYAQKGDPLDEPEFIASCLSAPRSHLLLDLHNVWMTAANAGFDPERYIERLPLDRVIEIHISGGNISDPAWLPSGRAMRLDSHDTAVHEDVWALAESWIPRCPNLRALTLERMEGTVEEDDVALLREELLRAQAGGHVTDFDLERYERVMAKVLIAPDPIAALDALEGDERALLEPIDSDGLRMAALLVARLRFERLMHGSARAGDWFESDPRSFARAFKRYHASVPPLSTFPLDEARAFEAWLTSDAARRSPA